MKMIPDNVFPVLEAGVVSFESREFVVLAAPLTQRHTFADLTEWFGAEKTPAGLARIGLAHGAVRDIFPSAVDSPNPIELDRAARAKLDYLALGDWHGTFRVDDRTWHSGTPEPDRFKANDSIYGLGASLWTRDLSRAHRVSRLLKAGTVSINTVDAVSVMTPFGGFKQSGNGRDLSLHAPEKYTALKTTWIAL
jgi:Aldehyde dehydrogenase family